MAKASYPENGDNTPAARAQRETYWRRILERWEASGLPKSTFCKREAISHSAFYWWLEELGRRDGKPRRARRVRAKIPAPTRPGFVPVHILPTIKPATHEPIEVLVGGQVIRVGSDFDSETLRRLVAVLEGQPPAGGIALEGRRC